MSNDEYMLIKNNGMGFIHQQHVPNCCIFIALGILWKLINKDDYLLHENIFKSSLNRDTTPEEMVYSLMKVKHPEIVVNLGETQIDTILEKFSAYSGLKISVILAENGMKWDLFKGNEKPDGIIVQYPNHYECAVLKSFVNN